MNILFLTTHLNAGGITSYLLTLSKGILRKGHKVTVVSSGGNMEEEFRKAGAKCITMNIRTKSELSPKLYTALGPLQALIDNESIDILHAHTRVTQVMGALLRKRTGRPLVTTCHGFFKKRLSRRLFPCWGDGVVAISEPVKEHLKSDFRVDENIIHLIPSGVDLDEFGPSDGAKRNRLREQFQLEDGFIVGNIARLSGVKGPDILVNAMREVATRIPKARLVLIGEGKMEGALRGQIKRLGLAGRVKLIPVVNRSSELLSLFDLFVMPSRQEGLGISIMEAQAAGLPVVASRVGGIPGLIRDGETGVLVEPENSGLLAKAIIGLYQDPNRLKALGQNAQKLIRSQYGAEHMVDRTLAAYEQIKKRDK